MVRMCRFPTRPFRVGSHRHARDTADKEVAKRHIVDRVPRRGLEQM